MEILSKALCTKAFNAKSINATENYMSPLKGNMVDNEFYLNKITSNVYKICC